MNGMLRTAACLIAASIATSISIWTTLSSVAAQPLDLAQHFRGKTIKLMIATGTGGAYGGYALLPQGPCDRARARWLEEYADTRLGDLFIWGLFYQKFVRRMVWQEEPDQERVDKVLDEDAPAALDYLEGELPASGYLFGPLGLADIALASFFVNAGYVGFAVDAGRWPRLAASWMC